MSCVYSSGVFPLYRYIYPYAFRAPRRTFCSLIRENDFSLLDIRNRILFNSSRKRFGNTSPWKVMLRGKNCAPIREIRFVPLSLVSNTKNCNIFHFSSHIIIWFPSGMLVYQKYRASGVLQPTSMFARHCPVISPIPVELAPTPDNQYRRGTCEKWTSTSI